MSEDDNKVKLVTVRVDEHLATAMRRAAGRERCSVSDVIRQSVVETMRTAGLLAE